MQALQILISCRRFVLVRSGIASQKLFGGPKKFRGAEIFVLRLAIGFCLGYRFSKHRMTRYSKNTATPTLVRCWLFRCYGNKTKNIDRRQTSKEKCAQPFQR